MFQIAQSEHQHDPMEYSLRCVHEVWVGIWHVDFMLFVSFLHLLGPQRKCVFLAGYKLLDFEVVSCRVDLL